jgi:hypothetical protein
MAQNAAKIFFMDGSLINPMKGVFLEWRKQEMRFSI